MNCKRRFALKPELSNICWHQLFCSCRWRRKLLITSSDSFTFGAITSQRPIVTVTFNFNARNRWKKTFCSPDDITGSIQVVSFQGRGAKNIAVGDTECICYRSSALKIVIVHVSSQASFEFSTRFYSV